MRLLKEVRNLTENYHVKSGMFHYFRDEYRQAEEFFRKALKDEADLSDADRKKARHYLTLSLMDLAARFGASGELEQAVEQLERAAAVGIGFPDIHYRLGSTLEELERLDEAIDAYREATRIQPSYLECWIALGFCLLRAGHVDATAGAFQRARELKPQLASLSVDRSAQAMQSRELAHHLRRPAVFGILGVDGRKALGDERLPLGAKGRRSSVEHANTRRVPSWPTRLRWKPKRPSPGFARGRVTHSAWRLKKRLAAFLSTSIDR